MKGLVQLSPQPVYRARCPDCGSSVEAHDWKLSGLWLFAQFACDKCGTEFFFDLPYSFGFVTPCSLNTKTAEAKAVYSGQWYASIVANAWKTRIHSDVPVVIEKREYGPDVCLVNCLNPWWGDAVSLLLRINKLRDLEGVDLVAVINPALRWLVPDFVKGIWMVQQNILQNFKWNEAVDEKIKAIIREQDLRVFVPVTFQAAYLTRQELHDACGIAPFPREEWLSRLKSGAVVTFMSRPDRAWSKSNLRKPRTFFRRVIARIEREFRFVRKAEAWCANRSQMRNIRRLACELHEILPKLEFAICGMGRDRSLPSWIKDLRVDKIDSNTNGTWAEQASRSHVFVGVHGSHTSLFASLAGACIELTPNDRLKNVLQCSPVTSREPREAIYCNRFLPIGTDPCYLADVIGGMILNYPYSALINADSLSRPLDAEELEAVREKLAQRQAAIGALDRQRLEYLAS